MQYSNELYHHGILGQKWGIRRYQNKDGSLTKAGIKRYGTVSNFNKVKKAEAKAKSDAIKAKTKANTDAEILKIKQKYGVDKTEKAKTESTKPKTKTISEMSDDEIRAKINRIQLENQLKSLQPKQISKGEKFAKALSDVALPALKNAARDSLEKYLKKTLNKALGVDEQTSEDISKKLEKEAKDLGNKVKIESSKRALNKYAEEDAAAKKAKEEAKKAKKDNSENKKEDPKPDQEKKTAEKSTGESKESKTYTGTVTGEGTSQYKQKSKWSTSDAVDAKFADIQDDPVTENGRSYVQGLLALPYDKNK